VVFGDNIQDDVAVYQDIQRSSPGQGHNFISAHLNGGLASHPADEFHTPTGCVFNFLQEDLILLYGKLYFRMGPEAHFLPNQQGDGNLSFGSDPHKISFPILTFLILTHLSMVMQDDK
jgi:hypothetical protein